MTSPHQHPYMDPAQWDLDSAHESEPGTVVVQTKDKGFVRKIKMPTKSFPHFVQDLTLDFSGMPKSRVKEIQAVIDGRAKYLGKGHQGLAFKVGKKTVKVSTTIPFHPDMQPHRSAREAADEIAAEGRLIQKLSRHPCVPEVKIYRHAGRTWLVKPYLTIIDEDKLSQKDVDDMEKCLRKLHAMNYMLGDRPQFGRKPQGRRAFFLDLGFARKVDPNNEYDVEDRDNEISVLETAAKLSGRRLKSRIAMAEDAWRLYRRLDFLLRAKFKNNAQKALDDPEWDEKFYHLSVLYNQADWGRSTERHDLIHKWWMSVYTREYEGL